MYGMRRTHPLSVEGSREVEEEMSRPSADTPERGAAFGRMGEIERPLSRSNKPPNDRGDK